MSFKSKYIYILILLVIIVLLRENFDFTLGDREAYLTLEGWNPNTALRNKLTSFIFSNLKYFGEILLCILYYRNVFKLSSLLLLNTRIKNYLNTRIVYYSIILCLFAPVTILFTSFAGKDIIGIYLASEICIDIIQLKYHKDTNNFNIFKIFKFIIYIILLFILRKLTAVFLVILLFYLFILLNKHRFKNLSLILLPISLIFIFLSWDQIYQLFYEEFEYQWLATASEQATFSSTNPDFNLDSFFKNSYQMITSVSLIHFGESFKKASLLLFNSFLTYISPLILFLIYFLKNLKFRNLFFFKALFLVSFFLLNSFLSQNNPAGAIRYMSSIIPIYTTFIFIVLPE